MATVKDVKDFVQGKLEEYNAKPDGSAFALGYQAALNDVNDVATKDVNANVTDTSKPADKSA